MNQDSKKVSPFSAEGINQGLSKVGGLLKTKKFWVDDPWYVRCSTRCLLLPYPK